MHVAVIGSGPTGVSAAYAALRRGWRVTMFDAGLTDSDSRPSAQVSRIGRKNQKKKDFVYRDFPAGPSTLAVPNDLVYTSSFAKGGLSNVWGASLGLPSKDYFDSISLPLSEFARARKTISEFLPRVSLMNDEQSGLLVLSRKLLSVYENYKELQFHDKRNFSIEGAQLAIKSEISNGCRYCNKCLVGCPHDLLWNAAQTVRSLSRLGMKYRAKFRIITVEKSIESCVSFSAIDEMGRPHNFGPFSRIFLACGPIETFRILASSNMVPTQAKMKDTGVFYFASGAIPLKRNPYSEERVSLAQLMLSINSLDDTQLTRVQLYDSSIGQHEKIKLHFPFLNALSDISLAKLLNNFIFGIGYIPAEDSHSLKLSLTDAKEVKVEIVPNDNFRSKVKLIKNTLSKVLVKLNSPLVPLSFSPGQPGEGFHVGSWLEMSQSELKTFSLSDHPNIHVVDSSAIPNLPLGPITELLMLNAIRVVQGIEID